MATLTEALHLFEHNGALKWLRTPAAVKRKRPRLTSGEKRGIISAEGAVRPKVEEYVVANLGWGATTSLFYPLVQESMTQTLSSKATLRKSPRASPPLCKWGDEPVVPYPQIQYTSNGRICQEHLLAQNAERAVRPGVYLLRTAAADLERGRLFFDERDPALSVPGRKASAGNGNGFRPLTPGRYRPPYISGGGAPRRMPGPDGYGGQRQSPPPAEGGFSSGALAAHPRAFEAAAGRPLEITPEQETARMFEGFWAGRETRAANSLPRTAPPRIPQSADYDSIYHYIEQRLSEAISCSAEGV